MKKEEGEEKEMMMMKKVKPGYISIPAIKSSNSLLTLNEKLFNYKFSQKTLTCSFSLILVLETSSSSPSYP